MNWMRVTYAENIPVRQGRSVNLGPFVIAIFNLGDRFHAVENMCPHRNGPLADGIVAGADVVCPLHAWRFSLETGEVRNQKDSHACLRTFETKVVDCVVMVCVPAAIPEVCEVASTHAG